MKRWLKNESSELMLPRNSSQCKLKNYHFDLGPLTGLPVGSAPPDNPTVGTLVSKSATISALKKRFC